MKVVIYCFLTGMLVLSSTADTVREETDPRFYPFRAENRKEVEAFFYSKVSPVHYDLWKGKKKRVDLNGIWKIRLLNLPRNPKKKTFITSGMQTIKVRDFSQEESQYGEKHRFFEENYDDSDWYHTIIPSPVRYRLKEQTICSQAGEAWFRRTFFLEKKDPEIRYILKFEKINDKAVVYINGRKAGSHTNVRTPSWFLFGSGADERFELDVTEQVRTGKNQISVKAYSPAYGRTGIIAPVWLELLPRVYADHILVTPLETKKALSLRAFFENTTGRTIPLAVSVQLQPWKSERYLRGKWQAETISLSTIQLPPGKSEQRFEVPMKEIHRWSPEDPQLYHLRLLDSDGKLLGQERFGYRTITVGKNSFQLNGIPFYLRGENVMLAAYQCPGEKEFFSELGVLNAGGCLIRYLTEYKAAGYNLMRLHMTCAPDLYYDLADEIGLTFYVEDMIDATRFNSVSGKWKMDEGQRESIRRRIFNEHNHPSILLRAGYNEAYDTIAYGTKFGQDGWAPILNEQYEEFKKWDSSRPCTSSSGRTSSKHYGHLSPSRHDAKGDFDDSHNYTGAISQAFQENSDSVNSPRMDKHMYTCANNGKERAMLLGEFGNLMVDPNSIRSRSWRKKVAAHIVNGDFDRKWLAEHADSLADKAPSIAASWVPFRIQATDPANGLRIHGLHLKHLFEIFRRQRESVAGYVIHSSLLLSYGAFQIQPQILAAVKTAQEPVIAMADATYPYNGISGNSVSSRIFLANDSAVPIKEAKVSVSVGGVEVTEISFPPLAPGEQSARSVHYRIPDLPSGRHNTEFTVRIQGKTISKNNYPGTFFNRKALPLSKQNRLMLLLPEKDSGLEKILDLLGLEYRISPEIPEHFSGVVVLTGRNSSGIREKIVGTAIQKGLRILLLELQETPDLLPGRLIAPLYPDTAELVLPSHPVFRNLSDDDFRMWNSTSERFSDRTLLSLGFYPFHEGALLMKQAQNSRRLMAAGEFLCGKGRFFFSQLRALDRFADDGAAALYLTNLFDYATGNFNHPDAPLLQRNAVRRRYEAVSGQKTFFVNLKTAANMGFTDKIAGDRKGGWSDQGPYPQDASFLKPGVLKAAGVPFELLDETKNHGKSCIVLRGGPETKTDFLPTEIRIPVERKAKRLYFLLASKWTPAKKRFGEIRINMNLQSGGIFQVHTIPLIEGENIGDWWNGTEVPHALTGFQHAVGNITLTAYVIEWVNPEPFAPVASVDLVSDKTTGYPILLGITGIE